MARERLLGLRLNEAEQKLLKALVKTANQKLSGLGLPAEVTPSSLVRSLIARAAEEQGLTEEVEESLPTRQVRKAPNVTDAVRKLREGKRTCP